MSDQVQKAVATYNKIASEYAQKLSGGSPKKEIDIFVNLLKSHSTVLNIGAAAGRDSRILQDKGFDVTGLDLSEELLKIARKQNPDINFILSDMRKLPFDNKLFDGIYASAVLHHLEITDMIPTLKEWNRVLVPGGVLFLKTKMGKGVITTHDDIALAEEREFTLLTLDDTDSILSESGFEKIELYSQEDKSRKGLFWINAFYKKV